MRKSWAEGLLQKLWNRLNCGHCRYGYGTFSSLRCFGIWCLEFNCVLIKAEDVESSDVYIHIRRFPKEEGEDYSEIKTLLSDSTEMLWNHRALGKSFLQSAFKQSDEKEDLNHA
jgi:hypothetical protein